MASLKSLAVSVYKADLVILHQRTNHSLHPLSLQFYSTCSLVTPSVFLGEISSMEQREAWKLVQPIQERQAGTTPPPPHPPLHPK